MSAEKNYKWTFAPKYPLDMGQGSEDASFPAFEKFALRNLIREYTQNSIDAHDTNASEPVKIKLTKGSLAVVDFPQLTEGLVSHLDACSANCSRDNFSKNPYPPKIEALKAWIESGSIPILVFSDFNTTGMDYVNERETGKNSKFNACVRQSCASFKAENSAGGSHGLGKTVGFVNSMINAVIYSTRTVDGVAFCEGVVKLCDHKIGDDYFKAHGFYDCNGGTDPGDDDNIPTAFLRETIGTDAIVLGIELDEDQINKLKKNLLRGFFMAIKQGQLTADLFGEIFCQDNLQEKMEQYFAAEEDLLDSIKKQYIGVHFSPRPYLTEVVCKAGEDENHLLYTTEVVNPEKWSNFSAKFYLWKNDDLKSKSSDTIIYMRDKLMTIEVRRKAEHRGYLGVVVVEDGSSELRKIEDVTHDKWVSAELKRLSKEDAKETKKVQSQLAEFVKDCIALAFPNNTDEERNLQSLTSVEVNLSGSSKFKSTEDASVWPTSNEVGDSRESKRSSKGGLTILESGKGKKKKRNGKRSKVERGGSKVPTDNPPTPPTPPAPPRPPMPPIPPLPPEPGPDKPISGDIKKGEFESENGNTEAGVSEQPVKRLRELRLYPRDFKLIPMTDSEYTHKLIIRPHKDCVGCSLALYISAIGNSGTPLELEKVGDGLTIAGEESNEIQGFDLHKDVANIIYFTPINKALNYSLIPKAYETR